MSAVFPPTEANADKLRAAIEELSGAYDRYDGHQLRDATMEYRGQFAEAVGDHKQGAAVLSAIGRGEASEALGLARQLLRDLERGATNTTITTIQLGVAASK